MAAGLELFDSLNIGVAVANGSRQLLFVNQIAEQILLARDGLDITAQRVLYAPGKPTSAALSNLIIEAAMSGIQVKSSSLLAVERPSGKRPLTLLVRSLNSRLSQSNPGETAALVLILDPELAINDAEIGLRQLFGLTSSESRLAKLFMEGKNLAECCEQMRIRTSTARMHLGNVFAKTGVQRQSQLVSLLWKSVGMIRPEQ